MQHLKIHINYDININDFNKFNIKTFLGVEITCACNKGHSEYIMYGLTPEILHKYNLTKTKVILETC